MLLTFMTVTTAALSSCSSGRQTARRPLPRNVAGEITLDEFTGNTGGGGFVITPDATLSNRARSVVDAAHQWLGTTYRYGGETRKGVDCSALVMNVYRESLGIKIPRTTAEQRRYAANVPRKELQPGDLIFFSSTKKRNGISHVGLYIGNDRFIHASSSRGVVVSRLSEKYFVSHYHSSGRITEMFAASDCPSMKEPDMLGDSLQIARAQLLEDMLTATIDSIYSIPVDDDPNLAPGL